MIFFKKCNIKVTAEDILNMYREKGISELYLSELSIIDGKLDSCTISVQESDNDFDVEVDINNIEDLRIQFKNHVEKLFNGNKNVVDKLLVKFDKVIKDERHAYERYKRDNVVIQWINNCDYETLDELVEQFVQEDVYEKPEECNDIDKSDRNVECSTPYHEYYYKRGIKFGISHILNKYRDIEFNILMYSKSIKFVLEVNKRHNKDGNRIGIEIFNCESYSVPNGVYYDDKDNSDIITAFTYTDSNYYFSENERKLIGNEGKMWYQRIYADTMLEFMLHVGGIRYTYFKNYATQSAWVLQTYTVNSEDFHENPYHHMLGHCYFPDEIAERFGTYLIEYVKQFGFCLMNDKIFCALEEYNKIISIKNDVHNLRNAKLRDFTCNFIKQIEKNYGYMKEFAALVEKRLLKHYESEVIK